MARTTRSWPSRRAWPSAFLAGKVEPLMPEQLGRLLLARHVGTVEAEHPGEVRVERAEHLERVAIALADHALEQLERGGAVAAVDGVGEVPRRHAAVVAEERLDLGGGDLGAGAVGGAEEVEQARAAGSARRPPT